MTLPAPQITLALSALALSALALSAPSAAHAQFKPGARSYTDEVAGVYRGDYECEGQRHPLLIEIPARGDATVYGLYEGREPLSFTAEVVEVQGRRHMRVELRPRRWLSRPSRDFEMMTLSGKLRGDHLAGRVKVDGCGRFDAELLSCASADSCRGRALGAFADYRDLLSGDVGRGGRGRRGYDDRRDHDRRDHDRRDHDRHDRRELLGMDPTAFSALRGQVQRASFDKDRLPLVAVAAANNRFTSAQVAELLKLWTFDPQRLEALGVLSVVIDDPENSHIILNTFSFDTHKTKASAILMAASAAPRAASAGRVEEREGRREERREGRRDERRDERHGGERGGRMTREMSSTDFATLKQQLSDASFDHEREPILKLAVRTNYFSCAQAAELLGEWSFDPQRLAALELLAPRLIDTERRHSLLDIFDFDSNKARAAEILGGH